MYGAVSHLTGVADLINSVLFSIITFIIYYITPSHFHYYLSSKTFIWRNVQFISNYFNRGTAFSQHAYIEQPPCYWTVPNWGFQWVPAWDERVQNYMVSLWPLFIVPFPWSIYPSNLINDLMFPWLMASFHWSLTQTPKVAQFFLFSI